MAEKKDEKKEEKKEEKSNDPNSKIEKKNKFILFAGIGAVLLIALSIGGFFIFKTISAKKNIQPATQEENGKSTEKKDEAKKDDHGDKKEEPKKDDHGDKKEEPKKDDHGDKKEEPKKDDHGGKKEEPKKDDHGAKKENPKGTDNFGDTFLIPKMDLNLGNSLENRFIRIAIAIEYRGGENQGFELKSRESQLKDIIITCVTNKTRIALISENGKENLRREILNRINEVTDRPIQNVYFTEFFVE